MSASATFQLKTDTSPDNIKEKIDSIWSGHAYFSNVWKQNDSDLISISLCYYFGHPKEEQETKKIIDYLLMNVNSKDLHQTLCWKHGD